MRSGRVYYSGGKIAKRFCAAAAPGIVAESPQARRKAGRGLGAESPVSSAKRWKGAQIPNYTLVFEQALNNSVIFWREITFYTKLLFLFTYSFRLTLRMKMVDLK
jgi:hypothetical protein